MMKADPAKDDVHESLIRIIIDVGMEPRDVASDIADALMSREDSPLVRYRDRAERNAKIARDLYRLPIWDAYRMRRRLRHINGEQS